MKDPGNQQSTIPQMETPNRGEELWGKKRRNALEGGGSQWGLVGTPMRELEIKLV